MKTQRRGSNRFARNLGLTLMSIGCGMASAQTPDFQITLTIIDEEREAGCQASLTAKRGRMRLIPLTAAGDITVVVAGQGVPNGTTLEFLVSEAGLKAGREIGEFVVAHCCTIPKR
jgi:hypothetical protein